eukprot:1033999-Rhodomonas_salina.2
METHIHRARAHMRRWRYMYTERARNRERDTHSRTLVLRSRIACNVGEGKGGCKGGCRGGGRRSGTLEVSSHLAEVRVDSDPNEPLVAPYSRSVPHSLARYGSGGSTIPNDYASKIRVGR